MKFLICPICGKTFPKNSLTDGQGRSVCSYHCVRLAQIAEAEERAEQRRQIIRQREEFRKNGQSKSTVPQYYLNMFGKNMAIPVAVYDSWNGSFEVFSSVNEAAEALDFSSATFYHCEREERCIAGRFAVKHMPVDPEELKKIAERDRRKRIQDGVAVAVYDSWNGSFEVFSSVNEAAEALDFSSATFYHCEREERCIAGRFAVKHMPVDPEELKKIAERDRRKRIQDGVAVAVYDSWNGSFEVFSSISKAVEALDSSKATFYRYERKERCIGGRFAVKRMPVDPEELKKIAEQNLKKGWMRNEESEES